MPQIQCKCRRILSYRIEQTGKVVACPGCSARIQLPAAPGQELRLQEDLPTAPSATARKPAPGAEPEQEYAVSEPALRAPAPPRTAIPARSMPEDTPAKASAAAKGSFWRELPGAFHYPLDDDGLVAMVVGLTFIIVGHVAIFFISFIPFIGLLLQVVVYGGLAGYFTGYAVSVVASSARGEANPPSLPRMGDYEDAVLRPLRVVMLLGALTVGPYFLYETWVRDANLWIGWALLLPGLSYLPMGLLRVSLDESISGLNPVPGVRAIGKVRREYLFIWGLVIFVTALEIIGGWVMRSCLHSFIASLGVFVLQQTVAFYLLFVAARLIGLLCFTSRDRLNWSAE